MHTFSWSFERQLGRSGDALAECTEDWMMVPINNRNVAQIAVHPTAETLKCLLTGRQLVALRAGLK